VIRRVALSLLVLLAALPVTALGLTVNEVAREVRCPTCDTPLDVSSAPVAVDMKQYIAQRIDAGWEKDRIIDGLVDEFGQGVLATPPKSGFDLVAWLVPALVVALGLAAIPVIARTWARPAAQEPTPPEPSAEESRRLEEELRRIR
jgi:cytochrome c-type biogenesis protein CcmH